MNRTRFHLSPDVFAVAALVLLWTLFFWRVLTPIRSDQASFKQGDFSGQFVAFGAYQYQRMSAGEIPLWNPYNNGGLPFIADTQAAVFYPPRLLTIAFSSASGTGWAYHTLELEAIAHVLALTLMMYAFVRRLTRTAPHSVFGALAAALTIGYGGYVSGYPPLQLALLEAGIWLPLAALGLYEASQGDKLRWSWLMLTGLALGLSWMAGHPQTSFFLTYFLMAYWAWRVGARRWPWTRFVFGVALFGVVSFGLVAVTLLPGLEYLLLTSRSGLGFDAAGGGFPIQDFAQMLVPRVMSLFSPLYIGIAGLAFAVHAVSARRPDSWFWAIVAVFALLLSLGANSPLYHLMYNVVPGLRFFRGQERAAYLFAHSAAILVGLAVATLPAFSTDKRLGRIVIILLALCAAGTLGAFTLWLNDRTTHLATLQAFTLSALWAAALWLILTLIARDLRWRYALLALIVFDLFAVSMNAPSNYDSRPADEQIPPNPLIAPILADANHPFRVDGFRGLHDNYGSYYQIADIQGISPLFLGGVQQIIEYGLPDERAWELFAVRYVFSDWEALNVPGEVLLRGTDRYGTVNLHRLSAPRPYAHLLYAYTLADSDEDARQILADPTFDARQTAILSRAPQLTLPTGDVQGEGTTITAYAPEQLTVMVNTPQNAILSLAHVDYPGWQARINGQAAQTIRAYGGLIALEVPAGEHTVTLTFEPMLYHIGAVISLVTWSALGLWGFVISIQGVRRGRHR